MLRTAELQAFPGSGSRQAGGPRLRNSAAMGRQSAIDVQAWTGKFPRFESCGLLGAGCIIPFFAVHASNPVQSIRVSRQGLLRDASNPATYVQVVQLVSQALMFSLSANFAAFLWAGVWHCTHKKTEPAALRGLRSQMSDLPTRMQLSKIQWSKQGTSLHKVPGQRFLTCQGSSHSLDLFGHT